MNLVSSIPLRQIILLLSARRNGEITALSRFGRIIFTPFDHFKGVGNEFVLPNVHFCSLRNRKRPSCSLCELRVRTREQKTNIFRTLYNPRLPSSGYCWVEYF